MIHKSLSIALCFCTILNSVAYTMDSDDRSISSYPNNIQSHLCLGDEEHFSAFYQQQVSPINHTLTRNALKEISQSFVSGGKSGFYAYTQDTLDFIRRLYKGEFNNLSTSTIKALIQRHFQTTVEQYLPKNNEARERGEIDSSTLTKLFTAMREQTYWALLRTNLFGKPRKVYVPERGVVETHYDVTTNLSTSFLNAIIPDFLPCRSVILSLSNNNLINNFMLRRIDNLFAKMTIQFCEQLTGRKASDFLPTLKTAGFLSLTGIAPFYLTYNMATTDYPDSEYLPELSKESLESLSEIWDYLEPRLSHYIRSALSETLMALLGFTVDKVSEPAFIKLSKTISNHSSNICMLSSCAIGYMGDYLTSVPYLDGIALGGLAYWFTNGIVNAVIPSGLEESRLKLVDIINEQVRLVVNYHAYGLLPLSSNEHRIFGLNPDPSEEERSLFREDYEARDQLLAESLLIAALKDLYQVSSSFFDNIPVISGMTKRIYDFIRSDSNDSLAAYTLLSPGESHAQTQYIDTAARFRLYRIVAELDRVKRLTGSYETHSLLQRVFDALMGEGDVKPNLSFEDQELLDAIRKYPSFAMRKDELDLLAKQFTWLSKSDRDNNLTPYMEKQRQLSQEFVDDAINVIVQFNQAVKNLDGYVDEPEEALEKLQLELPFNDYLVVLEAINTKETRKLFFKRKDAELKDLPTFHIALSEFPDLLAHRPGLIKLVQSTTLGVGLTPKEQLERAQELSKNKDAESIIQESIQIIKGTISEVEQQNGLWDRYQGYRDNYLRFFYANTFIKGMPESYFEELARAVKNQGSETITVDIEEILTKAYEKDPIIKKFREQLRRIVVDSKLRAKIHSLVKGHIWNVMNNIEEHQKNSQESSPSTQSSSWFSWNKEEKPVVDLSPENSEDTMGFIVPELPGISSVELQSVVGDGAEAFFLSKVIQDMLEKNDNIFEGRTGGNLIKKDMELISREVDNIRLRHVFSSESLMLIDQHQEELAYIIANDSRFNKSTVWIYDELFEVLKNRNMELINQIKNPGGLLQYIVEDYEGSKNIETLGMNSSFPEKDQ